MTIIISGDERKAAGKADDAIDFSRFFIPEEFTPLYYTAVYVELTEPQQRRYNQWWGLYLNEIFMFFESTMPRALENPALDSMRNELAAFAADEQEHVSRFRALNRAVAPDLYRDRDLYFIGGSQWRMWLWRRTCQSSSLLPALAWLLLIQEERAINYGRGFERARRPLEPMFRRVHLQHLADEGGHCNCDIQVLDLVWRRSSSRARRINASVFIWMLWEYFLTPKRVGLNVMDLWLEEFPELKPLRPEFRKRLRELRHSQPFIRSMYGADVVPRTLAKMREYPELQQLVDRVDALGSTREALYE